MIAATNVQDIQHHVCSSSKSKNVNCSVAGCDKKFFTQITLRYHLKHYHKIGNAEKAKSVPAAQAKPAPETKAAGAASGSKYFCSWPDCNKAYKAKSYLKK